MIRSTRIVAKPAVALGLLARRAGTAESLPGPCGNTPTPQPSTVVRNTVAKLRRSKRPEQRMPALGHDTKVNAVSTIDKARKSPPPPPHARPHLIEIRVPEKNRNEANGKDR